MKFRKIAAVIVGALVVPVFILGLMDPVEGGMALLVGGLVVAVIRLLAPVPIPRLEWGAWSSAVSIGIVTLVLAVSVYPMSERQSVESFWDLPWGLLASALLYEIAVLVTIAGSVSHVVRLWRWKPQSASELLQQG